MKLIRCKPRSADSCLPEPEVLPPCPGDKPCRRVILIVEGVTVGEQQRLYSLLMQWDECRYAQGWAIPVHQVRRFCADFNELAEEGQQ